MCSVGGSEIDGKNEITVMEKTVQKELTDSDICRKCKENKAIFILRGKDFYCKECFTTYFVHKFRSTIGKSKEIKHEDQILVAFSAGSNSTALLHLIRQGLSEDSSKRIRFHPHVLYIDESTLRSSIPSVEKVYEEISKLNFSFSCTNFEEILKDETAELLITSVKENEEKDVIVKEIAQKNSDLSNELTDLVEQRLKNRTSREDFIRQLRIELISRCAKQLGFKKVFLGYSATELSVQILSNVVLGRGSHISDHVQFKSVHFGVEFYRPLREIFDDEIKFYVESEKISVLEQGAKSINLRGSVVSCTRSFIYGLQKEFLNTVPTVFRTGGKLISGNRYNGISSEETEKKEASELLCLSCGLKIDTFNSAECSAFNSINLSKVLTNRQPPDSGKEVEDTPLNGKDSLELDLDYLKDFCYGCSNIMREMGTPDCYPQRIRKKLQEKQNRDQNKALIQEYLLED